MKKSIDTIVVFGDSTTCGFVDISGKGGWAGRLKRWFEMRDPKGNHLYNLAVDGATSRDVLREMEFELRSRRLGLIIISIGVNDSLRHPRGTSPNMVPLREFALNLRKIFKISKRFSQKVVFVSSEPPDEQKTLPVRWGKYYYSLEDEKKYYEKMREITKREGIPMVDIFAGWLASGERYKKLLYDGLHPNSRGHEEIFKSVLKFLKQKKLV